MKIKPIPVLTKKDPYERIMEFYYRLGQRGKKVVEPNLVKLTDADLISLIRDEINHAETVIADKHEMDIRIGVGMLWTNIGPSGGGRHPGMVELHPGWVKEPEGEAVNAV